MILQSIEKRTKTLFNNKFLVSCLFLDPRFQHTLAVQQKVEATGHLKAIWDRIQEINPIGPLCAPPTSAFLQADNSFDEKEELMYQFLSKGAQVELNSSTDTYTKIEHFKIPFQKIDDALKFWEGKQYSDPELFAIANVCFAVLPTQVNMYNDFIINIWIFTLVDYFLSCLISRKII